MIGKTLLIFGPGGIGKSPLDDIIRREVVRVDPYRLRERPRDKSENGGIPDLFYANRNLRSELTWIFDCLGATKETLSVEPPVEWFPKASTAFFDVRGEWQCLLLGALQANLAKAEIFAPVVPALFSRPDVRGLFGSLSIVILNPVESLASLSGDYRKLKKATENNCRNAGRSEKDIEKRIKSIDDPKAPEAAAWLAMLSLGGLEFPNWAFPEYVFQNERKQKLIEARKVLVSRSASLREFLLSEDEIHRMP
ncbi:MAG: hypothetical protein M1140_02220 [Chloroflexi bacterium]|nr:hypothetical protein [Chloroflexota bacterium]